MSKPIVPGTATVPAAILLHHVAILGKTGSGKSSTAKLAIEQAVAAGARVCILDPIKSDWWGLTSSADGKKPGLPFHILGGPRGHVPLHASAGAAIAEIVASGALPLSILDMADFEPGGQAKFFVDFVPMLLKRMRGVVVLVLEEAHLFAPKERSGIGQENMAVHWSKTLATAGRSKGIRLVAVTQRTQALHNAVLGSCETLITHRLTAPADQKPVIDWLKANTSKAVLDQVSTSLASLKTGQAWVCSGEAQGAELLHFRRIASYDNTATPTGNDLVADVATAPVDHDKLRAIIGEAVAEAEANDPKVLRKRVLELERQLSKAQQVAPSNPPVERPVLTDADRERFDALLMLSRRLFEDRTVLLNGVAERARSMMESALTEAVLDQRRAREDFAELLEDVGLRGVVMRVAEAAKAEAEEQAVQAGELLRRGVSTAAEVRRLYIEDEIPRTEPASSSPRTVVQSAGAEMPPGELAVLTAAMQFEGLTRDKLGILTGYKKSTRNTYIQRLEQRGWLSVHGAAIVPTTEGIAAVGSRFTPLPSGDALRAHWEAQLPEGERAILRVLASAYPRAVDREVIDTATGFKKSTRNTYLQRMAAKRLVVDTGRGQVRAAEELFS